MATPLLSIDVDPAGAIAMLTKLGPAVERHLLAAAQVSAASIAREARSRVSRRTGKTMAGITDELARDGTGYVVYVKTLADSWPNIDVALEWGTRMMTPRPFMQASALLEEGPHRRRIEQAIQAAIDEVSR